VAIKKVKAEVSSILINSVVITALSPMGSNIGGSTMGRDSQMEKVYINGIEGFWSFAKERLLKYHGVDAEKFPLYLKSWSSGITIATEIFLTTSSKY
jgi:hypothetical protein